MKQNKRLVDMTTGEQPKSSKFRRHPEKRREHRNKYRPDGGKRKG